MFRLIRSNICGYTFIELLIALALLGIVIAPLLTLFTTGYSLITDSRMHTTALNLCRARLEELRASGYNIVYDQYLASPAAPVIETNPFNITGFTRETKITVVELPPAMDAQEPALLLQVDVTVSWHEHNRERKETLSTYLGKR